MMVLSHSENRKVRCPFCGEEFYPKEKQRIIRRKLLIAEGRDAHVFSIYACQAFRQDREVHVMNFGGNTELSFFLRELKTLEGFDKLQSLVIARDAEKDTSSAVESVKSALANADLPSPDAPFCYASRGMPRTAFMLFPGPDHKNGTLENLCLATIHDEVDIMICVEAFLGCVLERGEQLKQKHKNKLYSYLSGKDKYKGMKLGEAARAGAWKWDHPALIPFKQIIKQM